MEQLLLIGHLAHAEIHLFELLERTEDLPTKKQLKELYNQTTQTRIKAMKESGIENIQTIWCSAKHLCLSFIHCEEIYSKTNDESALERSKEISLILDDLISSSIINTSNIKECPRCKKEVNNRLVKNHHKNINN